jgi:alkylation response protein AidB-like acyl-CoA dehydrogenase
MAEAAAAKLFVVPAAIEATEMARRIHGAYSYIREFKIERLCRAIAGATGIATTLEINKSIVVSWQTR